MPEKTERVVTVPDGPDEGFLPSPVSTMAATARFQALKAFRIQSFDPVIWVLFLGVTLNGFSSSIVLPFVSVYLYAYGGITAGDVGLAIFASTIIGSVFPLVGGELSDMLGRKRIFIAGLALLISSYLLLAWAVRSNAPFILYVALLSLSGMGSGLFRPVPSAIIADAVPPEKRLETYGLTRTGHNMGFAIGPVVGGMVAMISYTLVFMLTAAVSFIYLMLVAIFIKDTRTARKEKKGRDSMLVVLHDKPFVCFVLLASLASFIAAQMYSPLSVYAKGFAGLSEAEIGAFLSLNGVMVVLFQYTVTRLASRYRITTSMAVGMALNGLGFALIGLSHNFTALLVCIAIITTGELLYLPSFTTMSVNLSPDDKRGRYLGLSGLMGSAGFGVGALAGGLTLDSLSAMPGIFWLLIGTLSAVNAAGFIVLKKVIPTGADTLLKQPS